MHTHTSGTLEDVRARMAAHDDRLQALARERNPKDRAHFATLLREWEDMAAHLYRRGVSVPQTWSIRP